MFRFRFWKLAVLGCSLTQTPFVNAGPPTPGEPGRINLQTTVAPDQQLAERIAHRLDESGRLRHYTIDVAVLNGVVDLAGAVADQTQREEAVRLVQGLPGVNRVCDRLKIVTPLQQTQAPEFPELPAPKLVPVVPPPDPTPRAATGLAPEPTPLFQGPNVGPYDLGQPKMPPYAWPSYAPYNNYSRVAAPTAYPYQAFPFIGPCYPFPQIPPSWRSVKLEWNDGHWWFSPHSTRHDYWQLRYW